MVYNQSVLKGIKKSFEDVHLDVKIYQIPPALLWNCHHTINQFLSQVVAKER